MVGCYAVNDDSKITPLLHTDVADYVTDIPEADFSASRLKVYSRAIFAPSKRLRTPSACPIAAISRKALCRDTHK
jgi:hypothetical protein